MYIYRLRSQQKRANQWLWRKMIGTSENSRIQNQHLVFSEYQDSDAKNWKIKVKSDSYSTSVIFSSNMLSEDFVSVKMGVLENKDRDDTTLISLSGKTELLWFAQHAHNPWLFAIKRFYDFGFSINSLKKENQPVITEKDEFDYRDQSKVLTISSPPKNWDFLKEVFDIFSTTENFLLVGKFWLRP